MSVTPEKMAELTERLRLTMERMANAETPQERTAIAVATATGISEDTARQWAEQYDVTDLLPLGKPDAR